MNNLISNSSLSKGMLFLAVFGSTQESENNIFGSTMIDCVSTLSHVNNKSNNSNNNDLFELDSRVQINDFSVDNSEKIINGFIEKFISKSINLDEEIQEIINDKFWDMI